MFQGGSRCTTQLILSSDATELVCAWTFVDGPSNQSTSDTTALDLLIHRAVSKEDPKADKQLSAACSRHVNNCNEEWFEIGLPIPCGVFETAVCTSRITFTMLRRKGIVHRLVRPHSGVTSWHAGPLGKLCHCRSVRSHMATDMHL